MMLRVKLSDKVGVYTIRIVNVVRAVGGWLCKFIYPIRGDSESPED